MKFKRIIFFTMVGLIRVIATCVCALRKRIAVCAVLLATFVYTIVVFSSYNARLPRVDMMEQKMSMMQAHIHFLESLYHARHEEVINLQRGNKRISGELMSSNFHKETTMTPRIAAMLKNISGTRVASGLQPKTTLLRTLFVYQLLPHLMDNPLSLKPAFHMRGNRNFTDIVIGIPTVRRDKENYLMITLTHLVEGLSEEDQKTTIIVVFIGETDLEYVVNTARQIESQFPKYVENGLIEVISPAASFYPDMNPMVPTLGDSEKRFRWRTKQNLDTIYLMAYTKTRGTYYLMIEDDVICTKTFMRDIKDFTASVSVSNPNWVFIEFCPIGGIGKMFKSSELLKFITYVQLFYQNMPIDWLLESFLADRVCTIEKASEKCVKSKLSIRPKFKSSLFQHIGLYSSLKGKIQKIKDPSGILMAPTFYPHKNPSVDNLFTDIKEHADHSLRKAYEGETFFWGIKPKKNDVVEFWFEHPTVIKRYLFRSSNVEHPADKFYGTVVEVLPVGQNYTKVGEFDEFGLAEGTLNKEIGPLSCIRLRVKQNSNFWVILSEIELKPWEKYSR
ncbi:alpha-1,3-mannosyl-glycoprotein 4-beta-N-acetylglucosaminyltransferase A-like isoform X2 [Pectinophora gossypiella]|uniref:alpha-1,3-mannosyl-glycoprotein 4-beta-N-acetylglucosaminyltransferase A-like isoform X2 n=1 Tax=Pectinophora gossypiella TaxID=13191 RepID=UPI00214F13F5|nr:alpha-1,3-mannosyl-glycoprotein 4-beta-N-acetylglucosaminyltransferase A-like isoform X2 [Pectinophora gossypiella]